MHLLYVNHHRKHKVHFRSGRFAEKMVERGHEVTIVCISETEKRRIKEYDEKGVHYVEMPDLLPGSMRSGWDPWNTWNRSRYLKANADKFDLVHTFETRPATIFPVKAMLRKRKIPLVIDWVDWWGRGGLVTELRPRWYQVIFGGMETFFEEHYRTLGDSVTVIATALKQRAIGLGVKEEVIYKVTDGADLDFFEPSSRTEHRAAFDLDPEATYLGFSALDVTMDTGMALDTVKVLANSHPNTQLLMTGREPAGFKDMLKTKGVEHLVRHLGFLPYEDLPKALSCVDIFVLPFPDKPANRGRWPHKVGDYMALGRPTVSNPVGDIKELFEREAIGLLADESPEAFAAAVAELIDDPARAETMGAHAREVVIRDYAWDVVADQLEACYRATIAR